MLLISKYDLVLREKRQVFKAKNDIGNRHHIFLTVGSNSLNVVFHPVHLAHHTSVNIVFRRWDIQRSSQQLQGRVILIIPKTPVLKGIYHVGLPWLHILKIEVIWNRQVVDEQAPA